MALIICNECGKEFSDKAAACPNCGCPTNNYKTNQIIVNTTSASMVQDKAPREEVVKHLSYAANLEKTIFTYQNAYAAIEQKIRSLGHKRHVEKPEPLETSDITAPLWVILPVFLVAIIILSLSGGDFWSDLISVLTVVLVFFNTDLLARAGTALGIAVVIGFAFFIINLIVKLSGRSQAQKEYQLKLNQDFQRVENEKKMIEQLRQQQSVITNQINKNKELLQRLYSLDIIFPKYRHMVAIITMLEYFESGRCEQLTGGHGAYDTYSYEEKQNIIIGKLDVVIDMLNDIRNTQYLLYEAIQEANDTANRIYAQSERIIESNGRIAENTALTAYNTDIIRQNTTISAYIDVFSWK